MRDYQQTKNNPYQLPKTLYKRVVAVVRDYDRQKDRCIDIIHQASASLDGQPHGNGVGNPTETKAIQLEELSKELAAVERALTRVPAEYREAVFCKVKYDRWPRNVPVSTNVPTYWKSRFLYYVAKNLDLI